MFDTKKQLATSKEIISSAPYIVYALFVVKPLKFAHSTEFDTQPRSMCAARMLVWAIEWYAKLLWAKVVELEDHSIHQSGEREHCPVATTAWQFSSAKLV